MKSIKKLFYISSYLKLMIKNILRKKYGFDRHILYKVNMQKG